MNYQNNHFSKYQPFLAEQKPNIELNIKEKDSFDISNISDAFMLIYTDELLQSVAKNSYNDFTQKMKDKYGENYDCDPNKYEKNNYQCHSLKYGINKNDRKKFIIAIIFIGIHKLPQIELYLSDNFIFKNQLPNIISKAKFKFLYCALNLPINDKDLAIMMRKMKMMIFLITMKRMMKKPMKKMKKIVKKNESNVPRYKVLWY